MRIQRGLKKDSTHKRFVIGAHPIIEHFIELLTLRGIIGTYMRSDKRMKLDDDKALAILIHNILTTPHPLYEIQDWLVPLDAEHLGLVSEETKYIQDDRIGRALARFYNSRHKEVFFRLALRAIKIFELDCSQIHQDTTTVTFAGKYPGWSARELLTHGKNNYVTNSIMWPTRHKSFCHNIVRIIFHHIISKRRIWWHTLIGRCLPCSKLFSLVQLQ